MPKLPGHSLQPLVDKSFWGSVLLSPPSSDDFSLHCWCLELFREMSCGLWAASHSLLCIGVAVISDELSRSVANFPVSLAPWSAGSSLPGIFTLIHEPLVVQPSAPSSPSAQPPLPTNIVSPPPGDVAHRERSTENGTSRYSCTCPRWCVPQSIFLWTGG